jgi:hypothetical protein
MTVAENVKEDILRKLQSDIDDSNRYYEEYIENKIIDRYDMYWAEPEYYKKKFPKLSKSSTIVSTDVHDTIEWAMPSIMKVFFGSDDIISIQGVTADDDQQASMLQELIKFQLVRKNKAFQVFYHWFKDSLITGCGILKCYWNREVREVQKTEVLGAQQVDLLRQTGVTVNAVNQLSVDLYQVQYTVTQILVNQPKIENILASELRFTPKARTLDEAPFVAHRKRVTLDYLRRKEMEGMYESGSTDLVMENIKEPTDTQLEEKLFDNYQSNTSVDEARKEVEIYECYTKLDINGDGLLEDLIITKCENTILRIEENTYGRHPFFILSPEKDPHRIMPKKSYAEIIAELQHLKVALQKQIQIATALSNDPRSVVSEEAINIDDMIQGRAIIRKKAGYTMADVIQPLPVTPLAPWTFNYLQYIEDQKADRTGVTKYTQGADSKSLNKTATGISAIMQASNQRLEMICRMFAETGVMELFRFLIELDQKFIDNETVIRLNNQPMIVRPDDLAGEFDLVVNAGAGMGTKEVTLMNLQTIITLMMQIGATPYGQLLMSPVNVYNILKKYLEEMGFKNTDDYVTNPMQGGQFGQPGIPINPQGYPTGGESINSTGLPQGIPQGVPGMGNAPASPVQAGGFNAPTSFAPRG